MSILVPSSPGISSASAAKEQLQLSVHCVVFLLTCGSIPDLFFPTTLMHMISVACAECVVERKRESALVAAHKADSVTDWSRGERLVVKLSSGSKCTEQVKVFS